MSIGPLYGLRWNGPFIEGAPAQHTAALELFSALIPDNTTCIGTDCEWDPPQSAPPPVSYWCDGNVCPDGGYTCCYSSNQGLAECCNPDQHCNETEAVCQSG